MVVSLPEHESPSEARSTPKGKKFVHKEQMFVFQELTYERDAKMIIKELLPL